MTATQQAPGTGRTVAPARPRSPAEPSTAYLDALGRRTRRRAAESVPLSSPHAGAPARPAALARRAVADLGDEIGDLADTVFDLAEDCSPSKKEFDHPVLEEYLAFVQLHGTLHVGA